MLEAERLGLVDIVTRHDTHRALAELAIARGIPTIVQKPFATTWEDCVAIVEAAAKRRRLARRARELPLPGADAPRARGHRQRRDRHAELGTHQLPHRLRRLPRPSLISTTRSGSPSPMSASMCSTSRASFSARSSASPARRQRRNPSVRAEDTATMLLRHASGAVSVVECTYEARRLPDPFPETLLEIEGDARLDPV